MLNTLGIVEACDASPHFRAKVSRKLAGKSLLEWVVRRLTDCQQLDQVVVLAAGSPAGDWLEELVPPDVALLAPRPAELLSGYLHALSCHPASGLVRVRADNLFADAVLIDRLITSAAEHPACDYLSFTARSQGSALASPVGSFGEWCRAEALRRVSREAAPHERANFTRYLLSHPERYRVRLLSAPREMSRAESRLALDSEDDWDQVQTLLEALGPEGLDRQLSAELFRPTVAAAGASGEGRPSG